MLLERYGLKRRRMVTVYDLHESTEYKVRGRGGVSESLHVDCETSVPRRLSCLISFTIR